MNVYWVSKLIKWLYTELALKGMQLIPIASYENNDFFCYMYLKTIISWAIAQEMKGWIW